MLRSLGLLGSDSLAVIPVPPLVQSKSQAREEPKIKGRVQLSGHMPEGRGCLPESSTFQRLNFSTTEPREQSGNVYENK